MLKIDWVVTHFNHDLRPFQKDALNFGCNLIIYSKGAQKTGIPLPNIGIDSHTDLFHIITNYDNLGDVTIFCTDSAYTRDKKTRKLKYILENVRQCPGMIVHSVYADGSENNFTIATYREKNLIRAPISPFLAWLKNRIEFTGERPYISKKSIYAVTREVIRRRPREFYQNLMKDIQASVRGHDTEVAHYFERGWVEIFCQDKKELLCHVLVT
jgi:hypothetical protein